jgi:hypothetical protein
VNGFAEFFVAVLFVAHTLHSRVKSHSTQILFWYYQKATVKGKAHSIRFDEAPSFSGKWLGVSSSPSKEIISQACIVSSSAKHGYESITLSQVNTIESTNNQPFSFFLLTQLKISGNTRSGRTPVDIEP